VLYPDPDMRLSVSRAVAIETSRGWRIGKEKSAFKIDVIVALAMSVHAACVAQAQPYFDSSYSWVNGNDQADPKAQAKSEADDFYAARLHNYLAQHGAFGFGPPWGQR
jgi:hypothetical protein